MAKKNERTGSLTGLVGTVVLSSWRGIEYMKSRGRKSKKPRTVKQLQNQAKISLVSKFIYSMKDLLDRSFLAYAIKKTGTNAAFSYNFKNAIGGESPNFVIQYNRVLVSRGDLPNADGVTAAFADNAELHFSWQDNSGVGQARPTDLCICVAYWAEDHFTQYAIGPACRKDGAAVMNLAQFRGRTVETWLAFTSADGTENADSIYTGKFLV